LLLDHRDLVAPLPRLGFDNADGLFINEQRVVGRTDIGLVLANGNPQARVEIDGLPVLNNPADLDQTLIDLVARDLFGILVHRPCPSSFYFYVRRVVSPSCLSCSLSEAPGRSVFAVPGEAHRMNREHRVSADTGGAVTSCGR